MTRISTLVADVKRDVLLQQLSDAARELAKDDIFTSDWHDWFAGVDVISVMLKDEAMDVTSGT